MIFFCYFQDDIEHQHSYTTQCSSSSSRPTDDSISFTSTSPTELNFSDCSEESDDEGYETIPSPLTAYVNDRQSSIQSPPLPPVTASNTTPPIDIISNDGQTELASLIVNNQTNPFQRFSSELKSSSSDVVSTEISPVDPDACFAYEICRLESFRRQNRQIFAGVKVEELANAGFYLNAEGTIVRCPRCRIELPEDKFERIIRIGPPIPGSPLNDEPWTAMRVHRHEIGQLVGGDHSWCPWVTREPDGLYRNIPMVMNIQSKRRKFESLL